MASKLKPTLDPILKISSFGGNAVKDARLPHKGGRFTLFFRERP